MYMFMFPRACFELHLYPFTTSLAYTVVHLVVPSIPSIVLPVFCVVSLNTHPSRHWEKIAIEKMKNASRGGSEA